MTRDIEHRAAFESQGETSVRVLAQHGGTIGAEATAWLAEQQSLRDEASSAKRDEREERTQAIASEANAIARSALSSSRLANKIAITAAVLATAATIIAAVIGVMYAKS